jgi:hypothetical protein
MSEDRNKSPLPRSSDWAATKKLFSEQDDPTPVEYNEEAGTYTQIEWSRWVYEGPIEPESDTHVRGISLRQLVEDTNLYTEMRSAVRALESSGLDFCTVLCKSTGGRPSRDLILAPENAQIFAVRAQTEVGDQVARHIMRQLRNEVEREVQTVQAQVQTQEAQLADLQRDARLVPPIEARAEIKQLVRRHVRDSGVSFSDAYTHLYTEFEARHRIRIYERARRRTVKRKQDVSGLQVAEEDDLLPELLALTRYLYE